MLEARYKRMELVGFGGYGQVWRSEDRLKRQEVAIKLLQTISPQNVEDLRKEAQMYIQEHSNPYVLKLLDYNFNVGAPFLVLEYCRFGTLRSWVGWRNWYDIAGALQHTALGLESIHNKNGVHRDIKPDNLFVSDNFVIKIGDFGLGRFPFPFMNSWMTCTRRGTPEYMAPEVLKGAPCTPKSDIYSLGITGIELVTGSTRRESIEKVWIISNDFRSLLLQMTSENPDERPDDRSVADCIQCATRKYDSQVNTVLVAAAIVGALWLVDKATKKK